MSGISGAGNLVTDGLVLHLDAANPKSYVSGSTTWTDLSGNRNNGTLINSPTFSTSNAGLVILDGINDSISDNVLLSLIDDSSLTISIFVNINEPSLSINGGLVCNQRFQGEPDAAGFGLVINGAGNVAVNITKNISGATLTYENLCQFTMNRQQYAQYLFTYNSITKTIITYKNGIQQNSSTNINYAWNKNISNRYTYIGSNTQGGWGGLYKMNIGVVQIYNRALTQQEITQNYNVLKNRYI